MIGVEIEASPINPVELKIIRARVVKDILPRFHDVVADLMLRLGDTFTDARRYDIGCAVLMIQIEQMIAVWNKARHSDSEDGYDLLCHSVCRTLQLWLGLQIEGGPEVPSDIDLRPALGPNLAPVLKPVVDHVVASIKGALDHNGPVGMKPQQREGLVLAVLAGTIYSLGQAYGVQADVDQQMAWTRAVMAGIDPRYAVAPAPAG